MNTLELAQAVSKLGDAQRICEKLRHEQPLARVAMIALADLMVAIVPDSIPTGGKVPSHDLMAASSRGV